MSGLLCTWHFEQQRIHRCRNHYSIPVHQYDCARMQSLLEAAIGRICWNGNTLESKDEWGEHKVLLSSALGGLPHELSYDAFCARWMVCQQKKILGFLVIRDGKVENFIRKFHDPFSWGKSEIWKVCNLSQDTMWKRNKKASMLQASNGLLTLRTRTMFP